MMRNPFRKVCTDVRTQPRHPAPAEPADNLSYQDFTELCAKHSFFCDDDESAETLHEMVQEAIAADRARRPAPTEPATIYPAPFTEQELCNAWNSQADHANDWDSLDFFEQLAWAQTSAIAADRASRTAPARLRHCPTHGQQPPEAWGCPECVRELREELAALRVPPAEGEVGELVALRQQQAAPVPVSERLPDTSDPSECRMPDGDCWWFDPHQDGAWYMNTYQSCYTHWLPAHVLPLPGKATHD